MAATSSDRSYRNAPNMRHRTQGRPQSPQEHDPTRSMSSSATSLTPDSIQVPPDIVRKWQEIVVDGHLIETGSDDVPASAGSKLDRRQRRSRSSAPTLILR